MKKTKSNVCKIAAGIIAAMTVTIVSLKANTLGPNCHIEHGGYTFECYGNSSECEFDFGGENIVCKGSRLVVFHPDDPE